MCWHVFEMVSEHFDMRHILTLLCWYMNWSRVFRLGFLYMICICGKFVYVLWWGCLGLGWDVLHNVPSSECPESCVFGTSGARLGTATRSAQCDRPESGGIAMWTLPWDGGFLRYVAWWLCDTSGMGFALPRDGLWLWWLSRTCVLIYVPAHCFSCAMVWYIVWCISQHD